MVFRVFPSPPTAPLVVAGGGQSAFVPFQELAGGGTDDLTMFVRLVKLGSGCAPAGGADPRFRLRAGGGPAVDVAMFPNAAPVHDGQGNFVADVMGDAQGDGMYRVRVFISQPGSAWQLQIVNQDAEPHGFTWVVADNDREARQPWIDLPAAVGFEAFPGQVVTNSVRAANQGTGRLTIGDAVGLRPGPGFELVGVPGPISPNGCGAVDIRFTAPSTPGSSSPAYTATSDDTTAQQAPGRNRRVTLNATTRKLRPGTILVLYSSFTEPGGESQVAGVIQVNPATGEQTLVFSLPPSEDPASTNGVTVDANGDILVAAHRQLMRVDPATGDHTLVASGNLLRSVRGIALEASGKILVAAGRLIRVDPATGAQTALPTSFSPSSMQSMALEADGTILVCTAPLTSAPCKAIRVDPVTGDQTLVARLDLLENDPFGVALEASGKILVTSRGSGLIRADLVTGAQTVVTAIPLPTGVAVEADGNVLVGAVLSTAGASSVIRVNPRTGTQSTVCSLSTSPVLTALGIAVVPALPASPQGVQP